MTSEDICAFVDDILTELQKPTSSSSTPQLLNTLCNDKLFLDNMSVVQNDTKELSGKMNLDVDSDLKKHTDLKAKTLQNISEAKKEIRLLTSELQNEQRSEEAKLTTKYRQLEREKATFSVYHRVSGNMRLDSQHTGPEVRGVVSSAPTTAITFSMRPDELSTAKLTDRLWQTAARDHSVSKAAVDVK